MRLTARIWPEDGAFVAECVDLRVVSEGDSENEALANLPKPSRASSRRRIRPK
jgi:predicted RNase H-like HicB family nuclease